MVLLGLGLEGQEKFAMGERKEGWYSKVEEFRVQNTESGSSLASSGNSTQAGGSRSCRELGEQQLEGWRGSRATRGAFGSQPGAWGLFLPLCRLEPWILEQRDLRKHLTDKESESHMVNWLNYMFKNRAWFKSYCQMRISWRFLSCLNTYILLINMTILFPRCACLQMMGSVLLGLWVLIDPRSWVCQRVYCAELGLMLWTLTHTMQVGVYIGTVLLKGSSAMYIKTAFEIWTALTSNSFLKNLFKGTGQKCI